MRRHEAASLLAGSSLALLLPRRAGAQAPEPIRVAGPATEDLTAFYYGIKSGRFGQAGLDVSFIPTSSGSAAVTAMIAGTYEVAKSSLLGVFAAHLRNIPIALIAPEVMFTLKNPFALLEVAADATTKTGADLNGKTIGVPALGDLNTLAASAWVDKNGGDWKTLKFVEIPNAVAAAALQQHRIDAAIMQPPQLDAALKAGTTKTLGDPYAAIAPAFFVATFVARSDWATQHAAAVRRFSKVMSDAGAYTNSHARETLPLVEELTKIPQADIDNNRRSFNGTSIDAGPIQALIDASAKFGLIPSAFPARDIIFS
jgi:NitT/TauT family transport system substrate-binding protein